MRQHRGGVRRGILGLFALRFRFRAAGLGEETERHGLSGVHILKRFGRLMHGVQQVRSVAFHRLQEAHFILECDAEEGVIESKMQEAGGFLLFARGVGQRTCDWEGRDLQSDGPQPQCFAGVDAAALFGLTQAEQKILFALIGVLQRTLQRQKAVVDAFGIINRARRGCLLYTSPSPRDLSTSRMPSSA